MENELQPSDDSVGRIVEKDGVTYVVHDTTDGKHEVWIPTLPSQINNPGTPFWKYHGKPCQLRSARFGTKGGYPIKKKEGIIVYGKKDGTTSP